MAKKRKTKTKSAAKKTREEDQAPEEEVIYRYFTVLGFA